MPVSRGSYIIGIAGGTAAGKTRMCRSIIDALAGCGSNVVHVHMDSFLRPFDEEDRQRLIDRQLSYDHPKLIDDRKIVQAFGKLHDGGSTIQVPVYSRKTHSLTGEIIQIHPGDIVLFEGELVLWYTNVSKLLDMAVFVDTNSDTRLARIVTREAADSSDMAHLDKVLSFYLKFQKVEFEEFVMPSKKNADVIVPRGDENKVAERMIVERIRSIIAHPIRPRERNTTSFSEEIPPLPRLNSSASSLSLNTRPH